MTDQHPALAEKEMILPMAAPDDDAPPPDGSEAGEDPDQTVAVLHEGRSYQVPKALKNALMRHADYTRKTQELAQQRKAVAESQAHMVEAGRVQMLGLARLHALDRQIRPFTHLNWGALDARKGETLQKSRRRECE